MVPGGHGSMTRTLIGVLIVSVLLIQISPVKALSSEQVSFHRTLLRVRFLLGALENYKTDHAITPGDTVSYGKLLTSGDLPKSFCEDTVVKQVCGGGPIQNEFLSTKGPPMAMFDTFAVVRIIIPFWNPKDIHMARMRKIIQNESALVGKWDHQKGTIPVVLFELREGELIRFLYHLNRKEGYFNTELAI